MMFIPLILIGVVIYIVYKQLPNNNFKVISGGDNLLDILNERLARGEINEEEYNHKKNVLLKHE
ncbi:SHOCT domain-containing protein [Clostridium sp. CS001]|uniref:SHOCT domain-containing protein n=1 Tax=Clostridium sp. CS001 TaxID=2880648 RepID=UPI001CF37AF0|nr:SHOCT domain-containing protein [Clostridium sp. CS001]MCB2288629.1 SHOCT domain-containing protein [Clostridium sp. CS001]